MAVERVWPSAFRAFGSPSFRALWLAFLVSSIGTWMQIVAQSILVLRLSHQSAFALGCVSLSQASAFFLFALLGGGVADRIDRRRLLIVTQSSLMLLAASLGVLTLTGRITVPIIAAAAFLSGIILSFDQPSRAALVSSVVPPADLLNAISLQSSVFSAAAIIGPALSGIIVSWAGVPAVFFLNALSFIAMLAALLSLASQPVATPKHEKLIQQILDALRVVYSDALMLPAVCTYGMVLFSGPSLQLLLPVLALSRLHIGPAALGFLFSASGVGAVLGALMLGSLQANTVRLSQASLASWCAALVTIGIATNVAVTFSALVVLGASQSIIGSSSSMTLQSRVPPQQRGRVTSINSLLNMGVRPLGDFPAGGLIAAIGAPLTTVASASLVALTCLIVYASPIRQAFRQRSNKPM